MKWISFFVCFFIGLNGVKIKNIEVHVQSLEQKCIRIEEKEAPDISKECQILLNSLYEDSTLIKKKMNRQYKLRKRNKSNKKKYLSYKRQYQRYENWIDRLENCQNVLYERFRGLRGVNGVNPHKNMHMIAGNENLPVYGAANAFESNGLSCLGDEQYEVDTYSDSWQKPVENGTISAGCWSYPDGGLHLGVDLASPMFSEVRAMANGIVLYADNPVDSNNGYLGNWCGWPNGGGNTICMIVAVKNELYAVSYFHLSNEIDVMTGQQVYQSQVIAKSGNSGNSTGPHTHIEIFSLKQDLNSIVQYFRQSQADFSFGCGWQKPATCSAYACRLDPQKILEGV